VAEIENLSAESDFWSEPTRAQGILREKAQHEQLILSYEKQARVIDDAIAASELAEEANDEGLRAEATVAIEQANAGLRHLELARMLSDPKDHNNAILEFNAGAGGVESMDWAAMLYRMYVRYCERRGWKVEEADYLPGEEAGIKSASLVIRGTDAYGYLKGEAGVHRLVRISPFDSNARRHTSFASVFVYPEIEDNIEVNINPADVREDVYRSSGAGGQKVNKTSSAVRLTHIPTNTVVAIQNERSQHANRDTAWKILRSRLYDLEVRKRDAERDKVEASKMDISFGSQIRNYVLAPYRMVKDLRSGVETGNADAVLDGDLDQFVEPYLLGVRRKDRPVADEV
jgi:peptide chain release factor 2